MSPLLAQYNQWVSGRQIGPALPRPSIDFLEGAFGPLQPLVPMPIDVPLESGRPEPRRWQYPVGWNIPIGQPGTEGLKMASFPALRKYADLYSVVRAMLNIRKDEIAGTEWDVGATPEVAASIKGDKGAGEDIKDRARKVVHWFKRPDPEYYSFASWISSLLEERFVIDALSLYLHPTRIDGKGPFGSNLAALELLNGETIRPLVDMRGSTPRPPEPAYQQYLWGVPRSDLMSVLTDRDLDEMEDRLADEGIKLDDPETEYRADQLWYLPRHKRVWTPYGFSEIEMAVVPITLGLNRQSFLLDWFTEGTIPGVYVIAGDSYATPTQQRVLQDSLNAIAGDIAWKHRVIVLPPGSKTEAQKDLTWAKDIDQNIIEQVMMILHIQPHEVGMVPGGRTSGLGGKGMAEEQAAAIQKTRTIPELLWLKANLLDPIIQGVFGQKDLEWKWLGFEEEEDESQKTDSETKYISIGKLTIDEARIEDGLDPFNLPLTSTPIVVSGGTVTPLDPTVKAPPPPPAPAPALGGANPNDPAGQALAHASLPTKADSNKPKVNPLANLTSPKKGKRKKARNELVDRFAAHLKDQSDQIGDAQKEREKQLDEAKDKGKAVGKADKVTVADLLKWRVRYNDSKLDGDDGIVATYLRRSYPDDVLDWAGKAKWTFEPKVPLDQIDFGRRPGGRDPEKVQSIAKSLDQGASMDPTVLVDPEDGGKLRVADGYHRILGAEHAKWDKVPAFIGTGVAKDLDTIEGPMQDASDSKKKVAHAELAVLRRFLRKGGKVENFRTSAIDREVMKFLATDLDKGVDLSTAIDRAHGWVEKAGGNPQALRDWYNEGADGQIDWGSDGDFMQCVNVASKYMDEDQAKGFCNERHQDAVGGAPGTEKTISLSAPLATGLVPYDLAGQAPSSGSRCRLCGRVLGADGACPIHGPDDDGGGGSPAQKFDPSQPRDGNGKWSSGGSGGVSTDEGVLPTKDVSDRGAAAGRDAFEALARGQSPNLKPGEVAGLMQYALAHQGTPPLDLDHVRVQGTRQFGQDGLHIRRADMPQVPFEQRDQFFAFLRDKGVTVTATKVDPQSLQPTQDEISVQRTASVYQQIKAGDPETTDGIISSRDNYVIDGHHRWAGYTALSFEQPGITMNTYSVGMDAKPLLSLTGQWDTSLGIPSKQLGAQSDLAKIMVDEIDAELARRGVAILGKAEEGSFFTDEHGVHPIRNAPEYSPTIAGEGRGRDKPLGERYRIHQGRAPGEAKPVFGHRAGGQAGHEFAGQFGGAHGSTTEAFAREFNVPNDPMARAFGESTQSIHDAAGVARAPGQATAGLATGEPGKVGPLDPAFAAAQPPATPDGRSPDAVAAISKDLSSATPSNVESTGGGNVNETYKAQMGDTGVEAMLKPESGLAQDEMRAGIPVGADIGREMAAQAVNNALGGMVDMPVSVVRNDIPDFPGDKVLVQEWRAGSTISGSGTSWDDLNPDQVHAMALFDGIIGNTDRHSGNAMVDSSGNLIAIDHTLSFPNPKNVDSYDAYGNFRAGETAQSLGVDTLTPSDRTSLQSLLDQKSSLSTTLRSNGVRGNALSAMWDRVNYMLQSGEIVVNPYDYATGAGAS